MNSKSQAHILHSTILSPAPDASITAEYWWLFSDRDNKRHLLIQNRTIWPVGVSVDINTGTIESIPHDLLMKLTKSELKLSSNSRLPNMVDVWLATDLSEYPRAKVVHENDLPMLPMWYHPSITDIRFHWHNITRVLLRGRTECVDAKTVYVGGIVELMTTNSLATICLFLEGITMKKIVQMTVKDFMYLRTHPDLLIRLKPLSAVKILVHCRD